MDWLTAYILSKKYREEHSGGGGGGEAVDPNAPLVLMDWEGTPLKSYTKAEVLALEALPNPSDCAPYSNVDHELLVFQKWTRNLTNIKTWVRNHSNQSLGVGAIYTTTDLQNHNYWNSPRLDTATTISMQKRGTASVEDGAFSGCYSLTQINIPDGVTRIGDNQFNNCCSLTQINIPDGVTSIGNGTFNTCCSLTQINIPDSLVSIGNYAFYGCYSLTQINIPDSLVSIGNYAFYGCYSLTQINIPDRVTSIKANAFYNCRSIAQINIPSGVSSIEDNAFYNCVSLCDALLESKPTLANTNAFSNLPTNYRFYVQRANLPWFETETNWSTIYIQGHIVAIEDYIEYLESIGFNVDKYKEAT